MFSSRIEPSGLCGGDLNELDRKLAEVESLSEEEAKRRLGETVFRGSGNA
jgi:hypothetical protein